MKKKKTNPNRIPVNISEADIEQMKREAVHGTGLQEWAVFLAALSDFAETTADSLLDFYTRANDATTSIKTYDDTQECLANILDIAGATLPLRKVNLNIKTRKDIEKLCSQMKKNAQAAAFAIILEPVISQEMMEKEKLKTVIQKAVAMNEEIEDGEISVKDIQDMLLDEYGLHLENFENTAILRR